MTLTLACSGMDASIEAELTAAFAGVDGQLHHVWQLVDADHAEHVIVDMDSVTGPMHWIALHNAGKYVIAMTVAPRARTHYHLERPVSTEGLAYLLQGIAHSKGLMDAVQTTAPEQAAEQLVAETPAPEFNEAAIAGMDEAVIEDLLRPVYPSQSRRKSRAAAAQAKKPATTSPLAGVEQTQLAAAATDSGAPKTHPAPAPEASGTPPAPTVNARHSHIPVRADAEGAESGQTPTASNSDKATMDTTTNSAPATEPSAPGDNQTCSGHAVSSQPVAPAPAATRPPEPGRARQESLVADQDQAPVRDPAPTSGDDPASAQQQQGSGAATSPPTPAIPAQTGKGERRNRLGRWLQPGMLNGRLRLRSSRAPTLYIDAQARQYYGPATLKPLAGAFEGEVDLEEFETMSSTSWQREIAMLGPPRPLARLQWYAALLGGRGKLLDSATPDRRYQLLKWPETEREFPRHFRIATAMMKGPATLEEIAGASSVTQAEVADFINATLVSGHTAPADGTP